jgi:hypothetical protein
VIATAMNWTYQTIRKVVSSISAEPGDSGVAWFRGQLPDGGILGIDRGHDGVRGADGDGGERPRPWRAAG